MIELKSRLELIANGPTVLPIRWEMNDPRFNDNANAGNQNIVIIDTETDTDIDHKINGYDDVDK